MWIADGDASERHVYILYGTDCGWCKRLYAESRSRSADIQFRWVLLGGDGAAYVAETGTIEAIGNAFAGKLGEVLDHEQAMRTQDTNSWLTQVIGGQIAYPTFAYVGRSGLQVAVGARGDLSALLADIVARPGSSGHRSTGVALLAAPTPDVEPADISTFINYGEKPLSVYAFPNQTAMRVGQLEHMGMYERVHGFIGDQWIVVHGLRIGGRDIPGYIHAPEAVNLARMQFDMVPASGFVVADSEALPIYSHPNRGATMLDQLPPGYQLPRVGEVRINGEVWDAVVFDDGSRAYLPR